MARISLIKYLILFSLTVMVVVPAWAQSGNFRHTFTIYDDSQGNSLSGPDGVACVDDRILIADSGNSRLLVYMTGDDKSKLDLEIKLLRQVRPATVQIGSDGNFLVYDSRSKEILRFNSDGNALGKVQFANFPYGKRIIIKSFRVDSSGNIFLLDVYGRRVVVLDRAGVFSREIGYPEVFGFISDLAVDRRGNVFIIDSVRSQVFVAEPGVERFTPLSEQMAKDLPYPTHIEVDDRGLLYIVDEESGSLGIIRRDGSFSGKTFNRGRKEGLLYYPSQLCVEDGNRIIIADRDNNRVQVFMEKE